MVRVALGRVVPVGVGAGVVTAGTAVVAPVEVGVVAGAEAAAVGTRALGEGVARPGWRW